MSLRQRSLFILFLMVPRFFFSTTVHKEYRAIFSTACFARTYSSVTWNLLCSCARALLCSHALLCSRAQLCSRALLRPFDRSLFFQSCRKEVMLWARLCYIPGCNALMKIQKKTTQNAILILRITGVRHRVSGDVRAPSARRDAGSADQMECLLRHGHRLLYHLLCHPRHLLLSVWEIHEENILSK